MATTPTPIAAVLEQLRALKVKVGVFHMPAGTPVDECRYRDHDTLEGIPAVVDLYPLDEDAPPPVCVRCAIHIIGEQDITSLDVMVVENPTIVLVDDEPTLAEKVADRAALVATTPAGFAGSMTFIDNDGRYGSIENVGVETEVRIMGAVALRFDMTTAAARGSAKILRDVLDAAIDAAEYANRVSGVK